MNKNDVRPFCVGCSEFRFKHELSFKKVKK